MPGEDTHHSGAIGVRRAKEWLDATTRVTSSWTVKDDIDTSQLEFEWPFGGQSFSFDLGGVLAGGEFNKQSFLGESKLYTGDSDQGGHYDDWVSRCYVARGKEPKVSQHFMWITWHPFRVKTWAKLNTVEAVKTGLLVERNSKRVFNTSDADAAKAMIDEDLAQDVADRIWLIVLSEKQEKLVISPKHRGWLVGEQIARGEH